MLSVISPLADSKPDFLKHPHELRLDPSTSRPSYTVRRATPAVDRARPSHTSSQVMSGHHRGLPPPAAMTLPDPTRSSGPTSSRDFSAIVPPSQSQVPEDSLREYLIAKSEEDKREQERLKLEQRRIEERMLRDAYQSPVPPSLIPVLFAWIGGSPLASQTLELAQQQLAQSQQQHQQPAGTTLQQHIVPAHSSPDIRQDSRMGAVQYVPVQAPMVATAGAQAASGQVLSSHSQHQTVYPSPAYQSPKSRNRSMYAAPAQYGPHSTTPRSTVQNNLPRLTTNEPATSAPSSYAHQQEQPSPSPNLFFHHWQPPQQGGGKDSNKTSPKATQGQDQSSPPRKRKNTLQHERAPPPSTNPPNMSPAFSVASNGSHKSRGGSNNHHRPRSRANNYDPIRQERRRAQNGGSSRDSEASRSSRSGHLDERDRHDSPMPRKMES